MSTEKKVMVNDVLPPGEPTLRVTARPSDANPGGDLFGGWVMSEIDIAGAIPAVRRAKGPVVTVAVQSVRFLRPLLVHDVASFYTKLVKEGHTSMTVDIEVYVQRFWMGEDVILKVADATFVYVAVSKPGIKRDLPPM